MPSLKTVAACAMLVATILLLPSMAAGGGGSLQIVPTSLTAQADLPHAGIPPGQSAEAFVHAEFCYDIGGFNPQEGGFLLPLTVISAPDWLDVRVRTGYVDVLPPLGPTLTEGCLAVNEWSMLLTVHPDAPRGAAGTVEFRIDVEQEGGTGTYAPPDPVSVAGTARVAE